MLGSVCASKEGRRPGRQDSTHGLALLVVLLAAIGLMLLLAACGGGGDGASGGATQPPQPSVVTLSSPLAPDPSVCPYGGIQIDTGIDDNGNGVLDPAEVDQTQYVCHGAYSTIPSVTSTTPIQGATDAGVDQVVTATFNLPMNPSTITGATFLVFETGTGARHPGAVTFNAGTATFTPSFNLRSQTGYTARVTTGATDTTGNALLSNHDWTFTTGTDLSGPAVLYTAPYDTQASVPLGAYVKATFNKAINPATLDATTFTLVETSGSVPVSGAVSYNDPTGSATFLPDTALKPSTQYTATLAATVEDATGTALGSATTWSFTTTVGRFWQGREPVESLTGADMLYPKVGLDGRGNAHVVFTHNGSGLRPYTARFDATAGWQPELSLEPVDENRDASDIDLDVNEAGIAGFVYRFMEADGAPHGARARIYDPATQTWGAATVLGAVLADQIVRPKIALAPDGNAIVWTSKWFTWSSCCWGMHYAAYAHQTQSWGAFTVPTNSLGGSHHYTGQVVNTAKGFHFVYRGGSGAGYVTNANVTSTLSAVTVLPGASAATVSYPTVAANDNGNAAAGFFAGTQVYVTRYVYGTGWDASPTLLQDGTPGTVETPVVAMAPNNDILAAWIHHDGATRNLMVRRYDAAGSAWDVTPTALISGGPDVLEIQVAADGSGNFMLVWIQDNPGVGVGDVRARRFNGTTLAWESTYVLETEDFNARRVQLDVNAKGAAVAAWEQLGTDGLYSIYANRFR